MARSRRLLATGLLGLNVTLAGCGVAMRPVKFEANDVDWQALAGEWRGEYWLGTYDRHGLISFKLVADPKAASGDVLMISDRSAWPSQRYPTEPGTPRESYDRTRLLTIRVVRADDGQITGAIERYWDPDRRCEAAAAFRGSIDGDVIRGTVSSRCVGEARRVVEGRWRAERKPPIRTR